MDAEQQAIEIIDQSADLEPVERLKALAAADRQYQRASLLIAREFGEQLTRYREAHDGPVGSWRDFLENEVGVNYYRATRLMRYARVFQDPETFAECGIDSQRKAEAACAYADKMDLIDKAGRGLYGEAEKAQVREWLENAYHATTDPNITKPKKSRSRTATPIENDLTKLIGLIERAALKAEHLNEDDNLDQIIDLCTEIDGHLSTIRNRANGAIVEFIREYLIREPVD